MQTSTEHPQLAVPAHLPSEQAPSRSGPPIAPTTRPRPQLAPVIAARAARVRRRGGALASEVGQGTVEYVGLLLLMATLLAGVVTASQALGGKDQIGKKVVTHIGGAIDKAAGEGKR